MRESIIVWFKRDLRIADHPALDEAAAREMPIIPLYIVEPDMWHQPDASWRHWGFVQQSLIELRSGLASLGAPLVVRIGGATQVLEQMRHDYGVRAIVSHQETGNGWSFARDKAVAEWARAQSVDWVELPQSGVVRRLPTRDGWSAHRDQFVGAPIIAPPPKIKAYPDVEVGEIPTAQTLRLSPDGARDIQNGGRQAGLSLLTSFLTHRGETYRADMSSPLSGSSACSRVSPHLAWGTMSIRETVQETAARQAGLRALHRDWAGSLRSFQSRLAWRDHFTQKLEDAPDFETHCLHRAYEGLRPRIPNATRLSAWCNGETGLPFVDACMRALTATGWLNFRMRSMLMAVASYHLWLDWRATGAHLARMFTDYEPGIHWPQVQMQSGTTGMNTVRLYNPIKQGRDQDPSGAFTRRWVPELADIPDAYLQEPWRWYGAGRVLDRLYPAPIVDVKQAARAARDAVWGVRNQPDFRTQAKALVAKHASRVDSAPSSRKPPLKRVRPVTKSGNDAQLRFDF